MSRIKSVKPLPWITGALMVVVAAMLVTNATAFGGPLETVDWAVDRVIDGNGSGTLGSINVSYTTTVGGNSGAAFATNWNASLATNDAVGDGATHLEAATLGVIGGTQLQTIQFDQSIIDPILLFNFGTNRISFDFGSLSIALLDSNNASLAGNIVSFSGASNSASDGFALQIVGGFGPGNDLTFIMNSTTTPHESVGFTIGLTAIIEVDIDIKPGSDPNSINLGSAGKIPVAILSTPTFDAPAEVDPDTLRLAGAAVNLIGKADKFQCSNQDVNGDGLLDLVCHFETQTLFLLEPGDTVAVVEGSTFGGTPLRGEDAVNIVP